MRRSVLILVMAGAACRPDTYGQGVHVQLPAAEMEGSATGGRGRGSRGVHPAYQVQIPSGSSPNTLRPDSRMQVLVPHDEVLPRGMKRGAIPQRR